VLLRGPAFWSATHGTEGFEALECVAELLIVDLEATAEMCSGKGCPGCVEGIDDPLLERWGLIGVGSMDDEVRGSIGEAQVDRLGCGRRAVFGDELEADAIVHEIEV